MSRVRNNSAQSLKVLALLTICYGHIFMAQVGDASPGLVMKNWWILGDIGLIYFAMSSAYFTTLHYSTEAAMQNYWSRKVTRIGLQFMFISAVLFIFFLLRGDSGVFTFHTVINLLGLNGFLNWFGIPNQSPFGNGQWFITLLFIFYAAYPLLARYVTSMRGAHKLLLFAMLVCIAGQYFLPYGHSLWSCSFGFVAGFYLCRIQPKARYAFYILGLSVALLISYKAYGHNPVIAYSLIALLGYVLGALTLIRDIPWLNFKFLRPLDELLLPLYLIHSYFFQF